MIYITGDCHSDFVRFNKENFPEQREMTKDDYVIICGDFGGVWNVDEESKRETWWMDWLEGCPFTTLFVDGNHFLCKFAVCIYRVIFEESIHTASFCRNRSLDKLNCRK